VRIKKEVSQFYTGCGKILYEEIGRTLLEARAQAGGAVKSI